jgi:Leucine-rich repeat (LRR) protein
LKEIPRYLQGAGGANVLRFISVFLLLASFIRAAETTEWIHHAGGDFTRNQQGQIVSVNLSSSWVTDSDLGELATLPALTHLDLSLTRISDHGLRSLKDAPSITDLNLRFAELVTDEGLTIVRGWKHLKRLTLRGTKITDSTLDHLAEVTSLEVLDIGYVQITDVGLDRLTSLVHLKELTIGGNKLSDTGLLALRQLSNLSYLDVSGFQRTDSGLWSVSVTGSGMDSITTLAKLRRLRMNGTLVSARTLEKLKGLKQLEELDLQDCTHVSDDAAPLLASLPGLRVLDVTGTSMTPQGIQQIRRLKPQCKVVSGRGSLQAGKHSPA